MTDEAAVRALEQIELDKLRELVRRIEAEEQPTQLELLFQELRTLVGLTEEEAASAGTVPEEGVSTLLVESPSSQPAE